MRFCICFYGIVGRSLEHTFKSIKENIFEVLVEAGIEYDVYLHNNEVDILSSKRAGENNCKINNDCWKMLKPVEYISEKQADAPTNAERFDNELAHVPDVFNDNKQSYKYALYEMYSCKKVTELWKKRDPYDCYLYLRPDLEYIHKLDLDFIKWHVCRPGWDGKIMTAGWHTWGGLNDRIAFGSRSSILAWGERFDYIDEYLTTGSGKCFQAESFSYWVLIKKFKLQNVGIIGQKTAKFPRCSPFWARRVRADGRVHTSDLHEFPLE